MQYSNKSWAVAVSPHRQPGSERSILHPWIIVNLVVTLLVGLAWVLMSTSPDIDHTEGKRYRMFFSHTNILPSGLNGSLLYILHISRYMTKYSFWTYLGVQTEMLKLELKLAWILHACCFFPLCRVFNVDGIGISKSRREGKHHCIRHLKAFFLLCFDTWLICHCIY